jgi:glucose/arabinose dehydrogenase/type 1 glutamine amidotransferase
MAWHFGLPRPQRNRSGCHPTTRDKRRLTFELLEARQMLAAFDVLVFSRTAGFRHDSIDEGLAAIQALGAANDFTVSHTEIPGDFTANNLAQYEAVVFLNTTGDVLNSTQQTAFQNYVRAGGGYVGVHSAADTEHGWAWYGQLVGAYFASHPAIQQATIKVADHTHGSTAHLPDRWVRTDEWYNYTVNPRGNVHVLMTLDETTYSPGSGAQGHDHPISWYKYFEGGRSWYTGLGHRAQTYAEPLFRDHLLGGILFAAGQAPADLGATINANWRKVELATNAVDPMNIRNPMSLEVASDGRVFFVERFGKVKIYNPATNSTSLAGELSTFTGSEQGLLGIALDPDFETNNWIYLFWSPSAGTNQRLARFTLVDNQLDMSSQKILLEFPTNRSSTNHVAGSLAFGPGGELYISTGDNTNPFQSDGFNPIDERPGRAIFDAQRSAGNANSLNGKILRIKPQPDGTYTIPTGNLFPADGSAGRPEIYVMGNRNPFRISIDPETGWLYWGEVGPDAQTDDANRGPRGYDEFNQARQAGNFGWPYIIADNKPYRDFNFETGVSGPAFNPAALVNNSPNNTGPTNLPPAQPAWIWYPYGTSSQFPELESGGRTAMAGPVYHFDPALASEIKLPEYLDDTFIMYEWSRNRFWEVKLDDQGQPLKINRLFSNLSFIRPMDAELGPDGALYVLEWGSGFGGNNDDSKLVRVEYLGNLPNTIGDYNRGGEVDAADYVTWRRNLGQKVTTPFQGADGSGNARVGEEDYAVWRANFGRSLPSPAVGARSAAVTVSGPTSDALVTASVTDAAPEPLVQLALQEHRARSEAPRPRHRERTVRHELAGFDSDVHLLLAIDRVHHSRPHNVSLAITGDSNHGQSENPSNRTLLDDPLAIAWENWR